MTCEEGTHPAEEVEETNESLQDVRLLVIHPASLPSLAEQQHLSG